MWYMLKGPMLIVFIVFFAVIAALFNALAAVIQRYQAGEPQPLELFRGEFSKRLFNDRLWIAGFGLEIVAFIFQASALIHGSLLIVQPIMTIDLVFLLLILHFFKNVRVGKREWLAIVMVCGGISGMLISAMPKVCHKPLILTHFLLVALLVLALISIGIYIVRHSAKNSTRALVAGIAAGLSFAMVAVITKIVTGQLDHGIWYILSHWQVWALLIAGIVATVMTQNAYGSGPVAVSQPTMEIIEPLISIVLGIYLFGDVINLGLVNIIFALITAVIAGIGIALLGTSKRLAVK